MNIAQHVERFARLFPNKPAIVFEDRRISYRSLEEMAGRTASGLGALGVSPGDRVAIYLPNSPEFVEAYLAILKLGAVAVSASSMLTTAEMDHLLADCTPKALFTTAELWPRIEPLLDARISRARVFLCEGEAPGAATLESLRRCGAGPLQARSLEPEAPAVILYTSGTTGQQKGVVLSHSNVVSNICTVGRYLRMVPSDVVLIAIPLFHVAGQNVLMNSGLNAGATLVLHRRFDAQRCLASIAEHRVTVMLAVPTIYMALLEAGANARSLASLRVTKSGAAPMPVEVARRWHDACGKILVEGYGLTETAPAATFNHEYEYRAGSVGTAVDMVDVRVVDEADREVPPGTWGEVVIRGPNVMLGYWNRPVETAEVLRGGWMHTGDIGYLDADGYLYLVDRLKDMINTAGFKVWPREIEEILHRHPAVAECAVVGVPDALKGELARAFVVRRPGLTASAEDLDAYCRQYLAAYKVPRGYTFVSELPRSPSGKILKRILRDAATTLA